MPTLLKTKSIYFNDVNLIQQIGKVRSRKDVPKELYRIICSPMTALIGPVFAVKAAQLGLSITIPRSKFLGLEKKVEIYKSFNTETGVEIFPNNKQLCFMGIGPNEPENNISYLNTIVNSKSFLVDMANGTIPQIQECLQKIYNITGQIENLMIGNVMTSLGLDYLYRKLLLTGICKNLFVRIGTGNGSACKTSDEVGINRGQITELFECNEKKLFIRDGLGCQSLNIVSDGGISKPGFAVKAFGAGSDYVLMGGYFVNSFEAETHISGDGTYFGCASERQNKLDGLDKHSEGKERIVDKIELKPLEEIVKQLWGGISSAVSYSGVSNLTDFVGNGVFEEKCNSLPPKKRY